MAAIGYTSGDPAKVDVADVGQVGGPAGPLDGSGLIPTSQLLLANTPLPEDQNLIGWTFDPAAGQSSNPLPIGAVQLLKVILRHPATITNIHARVSGTAGVGVSNAWAGLYDSGGTLRGQTADQSTSWQSTGLKTMPMTTSYSAATGTYFLALLVGAATTAPNFIRGGNVDVHNAGLSAGNYRSGLFDSSLTALPASIAMASMTSGALLWWMGVS